MRRRVELTTLDMLEISRYDAVRARPSILLAAFFPSAIVLWPLTWLRITAPGYFDGDPISLLIARVV